MTHSLKVETYRQLMESRGIGQSTAVPPLWELLWRLGINLPPPFFMGFFSLFLFSGSVFGVLFGFGAWVLGNRGARSMALSEAGWVALITGAAFGFAVAWYSRRFAAKQHLGPWSEFGRSDLHT